MKLLETCSCACPTGVKSELIKGATDLQYLFDRFSADELYFSTVRSKGILYNNEANIFQHVLWYVYL